MQLGFSRVLLPDCGKCAQYQWAFVVVVSILLENRSLQRQRRPTGEQ